MKKLLTALLVPVCLVACQPEKKVAYNIDSVASPKGTEVFQPNWENLAEHYQFPEWFVDAKFGIFIHWGVYAVPAYGSEWYARTMYLQDSREYKHHIETWGAHTEFGYKDFVPMFKAEKFDADEWADLFKKSGAKYVVPVAEHHDGFSMYDSDLNEWNSVKMGPKKDIVGLLKTAVEKEGLVFGLSTHRAENAWFFNGGMQFPSDVQDMSISLYGRRYESEKYTEEFAREWLTHTYELINKYEPKLIWFDWTVNNPVLMPYFNKFLAYYYNNALDWGDQVAVNTKQGYPTNIHVWDVERGKSGKMMQFPWQTDTSVGKRSWSYIDGEENKTPEQIVHDLIDIVSKNGNLLLNIGPRADGTITDEQKAVLLSIGKWLEVNGEAIYGTRCWKKFGEGDAEPTKGSFSDNTATPYSTRDIRFTTKGNDFYAIVLNWDEKGVFVASLDKEAIADAKIQQVTLLGSEEKIAWEQTDKGLKLSFPKNKPCAYAYSFKITFDKPVGQHLASEAVNEVMKHGS
ncbi:alpha-L-fucosidase [Parabacteroides sp. PFB2-12]|uniref:alpha-L-fucosidase n=1 Tax=unclassified Parabacteroides TaxID=2649774 RepID=UPI00247501FE|nr:MULTISPECIES: alpha-L-fucosidase [unclassified Parabacteroides]MDH6341409.1 alpha-L-fucosidase [Parabacteroides sp. PM6-13]MDH6389203.1 alpha-L-fucosidase [Parabacteroides sp. PFB2-12]